MAARRQPPTSRRSVGAQRARRKPGPTRGPYGYPASPRVLSGSSREFLASLSVPVSLCLPVVERPRELSGRPEERLLASNRRTSGTSLISSRSTRNIDTTHYSNTLGLEAALAQPGDLAAAVSPLPGASGHAVARPSASTMVSSGQTDDVRRSRKPCIRSLRFDQCARLPCLFALGKRASRPRGNVRVYVRCNAFSSWALVILDRPCTLARRASS